MTENRNNKQKIEHRILRNQRGSCKEKYIKLYTITYPYMYPENVLMLRLVKTKKVVLLNWLNLEFET